MSTVIGNLALLLMVMQAMSVSGNIKVTPVVPELNQSATLSCYMSASAPRLWIIGSAGQVECNQNICSPDAMPDDNYTFLADNDKIQLIFQTLRRARDEQMWICKNSSISYNISLQIYTIPRGLEVNQVPVENVDLSMTSATLSCRTTSCTYPEPSIQWLYKDQPVSTKYETYTSSTPYGTQQSCVSPEKIYSNSLHLAQNTTLTDNSDKMVTFFCRIGYSDPSKNITASSSRTVRFAVKVIEAVIQQNSQNITDILNVTSGEQVALTCLTGTSRPPPTIEWYLGSRWIGSGASLSYIASDADHNAVVYCSAYNTKPDLKINSNKPKLYVRVFVRYVNIFGPTDVLHKTPATFTCNTSVSRPDATVQWFIGNTEVTTVIQNINKTDNGLPYVESSLTFDPDGVSHHGKEIYCQAYTITANEAVTSTKLTLYVKVYVNSVTLDPPGASVTFLDKTENSLKCITSSCRPQPSIRWWLDGNEVTNLSNTVVTPNSTLYVASSELRLTLDKTQQAKKVYCDAQVNGQINATESMKPAINVWYQPSLPSVETFQDSFPWLENRTGTLQCVTTDYGNPRATVMWKSSRGTEGMDSHLVFRNLSSHDHGKTVYCQLQNNFTIIKGLHIVSPTKTLNVEYVPIISLSPSEQPVRIKEKSMLIVTCTASGNPPPIVQWQNRNTINNTLRIPDILRNSTGSYTCVANSSSTNYNGVVLHREESVSVIVEYAPDVRVNLISGSTVVNSTAVLMCAPQGEPPRYTFHQWIHMVGQTEIRSLAGVNTLSFSNLTLPNISIQDMGIYICTVDNSITGLDGQINQMGDTSVFVQGVPVIGETKSTFTGETNKSASIEIPFYSSPSIKTLKFSKQLDLCEISNASNVSIYISPSNITMMFYTKKVMIPGHVAVLHFRNLQDTDFDNYTLQLSNDLGTVFVQFDFIASAPPSVPKTFFFSHIEDGLLVFGIEKGFNGGHEQTFIIEHQPLGIPEAAWSTILKINETDLHSPFTNGTYYIKIPKLQAGQYIFRVYACNKNGNSRTTESVHVEIQTGLPSPVNREFPVAAVAGSVIGTAVLVIAIVALALVVKRRALKPKMEAFEGEEMDSTNGKHQESGLVDNPVYDSSDSRYGTGPAVAEYAAAVKPKRMVSHAEDPSKLYAQVDKTNTNKGKIASKGNHGKRPRAASKEKHGKTSRGDVYENATLAVKSSAANVYENPGHSAADGKNVCENPEASTSKVPLVKKDGLLYVDLMLSPPTTKAGKPVIHGMENRTDYAEIAYGKRGEPLLDSDEEKESGGAKKNNGTKLSADE